jgi:hypothetical protein
MPFARAADELQRQRGVTVSETTARQRTEAAGAAYVAAQTAELDRLERDVPPAPAGPPVQLLSADGALVPLVGGAWAEVKTLAIGEVEGGTPAGHATALSYFSRLANAATFTRLATVETHRRGTEAAGVVCAVADGADWLQGFVDYHRPDAVRILDFPHAAGYLTAAAAAAWADAPDRQAAWLAVQCHELKHGEPAAVLAALRTVAAEVAAAGASAVARETITTALGYLEKRQAHVQYAAFQAAGYPIASGAVESAHKVMVEARLKGAGMHWAPAHVNPMAALRNVVYNDRWEEAWGQLSTQLRQQAWARAQARRQARRSPALPAPAPVLAVSEPDLPLWDDDPAAAPAPPPTPTPDQPARPAADHPWRRPFSRSRAA